MVHKRTFGELSKLPSGRYRARYTGPDGQRHSAPRTFDTKGDANTWLTLRSAEMIRDEWTPPLTNTGLRFGPYSAKWLAERKLKPRTREHYGKILAAHLAAFHDVPLRRITPAMVDQWWGDLDTGPTMKAHAYSLLRTIMGTALSRDLITANPCRITGAGASEPARKVQLPTLGELGAAADAMPEQYRLMVLLGAWCAMRFGELTGLRRRDIEPDGTVIRIRRGVVRAQRQLQVGTPKSKAGVRDVAVPPHLHGAVRNHLADHTAPGRDGLLFPGPTGGFLSPETFYRYWHPAREAAGREDLHFHDLRHAGATLAAGAGATIAELMARLGHSTPAAAMRYQHAAAGRDAEIARRLSGLVANLENNGEGGAGR